jgi:type I restriction enzyme S subunit
VTALGSLLTEVGPGFACGKEDADGIFQFRMHNISKSSELVLDKRRRVPRDAHKQLARFHVRPGDILFNATNSPDGVGKSILVPNLDEPAVFSNHFLRLRVHENLLNPAYLWRWLQYQYRHGVFLGLTRRWVNQATVSRDDLLALDIPELPLDEQRRIAAILDHADTLRAKRRQALAHLDSLPQAIFHRMFGDPDDATAAVPFGDIATLSGGRNLVADDSSADSAYRVLKISAVTTGQFRPEESKPLPSDYTPPTTHLVRQGDLLMSRANTAELVGAVAYVHSTPDSLALPDKVWRFAWRDPHSSPLFYQALMQTPTIRRRISRLASGTGGSMKNISKAKLDQMPVPHVEICRQQEFARLVCDVKQRRAKTVAAVATHDALFASLQTRAFKGEL